MIEFSIDTIRGMALGLEFPGAFAEDMAWSIIVDVVIFRFSLIKWNRDD